MRLGVGVRALGQARLPSRPPVARSRPRRLTPRGQDGPLFADAARRGAARRDRGRGDGGRPMSPQTAPVALPIAPARAIPQRDAGWLRAAHQAKLLAWASLAWMT